MCFMISGSTDEINHGAIKGAYRQLRGRTGRKSAGRERQKNHHLLQPRPRERAMWQKNLCEQGYDAVSLKGGYIAWLMAEIKSRRQTRSAIPWKKACARNSTRTFSANSRKPSISTNW
ncbi:MAG: hypothetical protein ACLUD2_07490 [Clostridium sp.]